MAEPLPRHDFSVWNEAVAFEQRRRSKSLLWLERRNRAITALSWGAAISGVVLAVGVSAAAVLWTLGAGASAPVREPTPAVVPEPPLALETLERDPTTNVVNYYTLFRSSPSGIAGVGPVTTASTFASSRDEKPTTEYCYLERRRGAGARRLITLASSPGDHQKAVPIEPNNAELDDMRLDRAQVRGLRAKCLFIGVGKPSAAARPMER